MIFVVFQGVYSFNHLIVPTLKVAKTIATTGKYTTTYEWLLPGHKPILRYAE